MNTRIIQLTILSILFCGASLHADQIKIPLGSQSAELNNISRPTLGMSKARVQQQYGQPIKENPAVGKPPISSWEYAHFIVYFEYDHVIDSVLKATYHESTTTIVKGTVVEEAGAAESTSEQTVPQEETVKKSKEMQEEDLDLHRK